MATSAERTGHHAGALGHGKLRQILAYGRKVFALDSLLGGVRDRRIHPQVPTSLIARIVFLLGLLRIRSLNALEPKLAEPWMQRALGARVRAKPLCSVDTIAYSLARADVDSARTSVVRLIQKAERNKLFREGWHAAKRVVAIDGWEPFASFDRHCAGCLSRNVKVKQGDDTITRTQYYHAFVVALLIDERLDVVLDMEPIARADVRAGNSTKSSQNESELTAAKRLLPRLRTAYGKWIDAVVVDALYANGPFLSLADEAGLGVFVILKKATDEPLKDALNLCHGKPADHAFKLNDEHVEIWDRKDIRTLKTYQGAIRVVRALVHRDDDHAPHTWCIGATGCAATLHPKQILAVARGRWHIENTAFHQFTTAWQFDHVFTHSPNAIPALFWIFFLAFNLLQIFLYRQLSTYGRNRGNDVTRTISRLIDEMLDDLVRCVATLDWNSS